MLPNLEEFQASELSCGAISQLAKRLPHLKLLKLDLINLESFKTAEDHEEASADQVNGASGSQSHWPGEASTEVK